MSAVSRVGSRHWPCSPRSRSMRKLMPPCGSWWPALTRSLSLSLGAGRLVGRSYLIPMLSDYILVAGKSSASTRTSSRCLPGALRSRRGHGRYVLIAIWKSGIHSGARLCPSAISTASLSTLASASTPQTLQTMAFCAQASSHLRVHRCGRITRKRLFVPHSTVVSGFVSFSLPHWQRSTGPGQCQAANGACNLARVRVRAGARLLGRAANCGACVLLPPTASLSRSRAEQDRRRCNRMHRLSLTLRRAQDPAP